VGARVEARAEAEMVGKMVEVRVGAMGLERVGVERVAATAGEASLAAAVVRAMAAAAPAVPSKLRRGQRRR
jgi:hypothetical protein